MTADGKLDDAQTDAHESPSPEDTVIDGGTSPLPSEAGEASSGDVAPVDAATPPDDPASASGGDHPPSTPPSPPSPPSSPPTLATPSTQSSPPPSSRPAWLRWLLRLLGVLCLVVLCAGGYAGYDAWRFLNVPPQTPGEETTFDVEPGASFDKVARQLEQRGLVSSAWRFKLLGHWMEWTGSLKAGRFAMHTGWTPGRVLDQLVNGQPILYRLTLREGLTWWEVGRLLESEGFARFSDFSAVIHDPAFLRHYGIPFDSAEGFLFPETYLLKKPQTLNREAARSVAGRLVDTFWRSTAAVLPLGHRTPPDELRRLVTLASIVERETGVPAERARVAGVYTNRLRVGMILQADPTVIYGLGPTFDGNLRRSHLQDGDNPYNTYRKPGLPPGPICSPGFEALQAAVKPEDHGYFYFVARKDGTHQFSTNLDDHNAAVRKFQLGR
ncbi:endolytic transglycosylase MltG [Nitratidesulfovibrio vulgaris]|uniref:endolytic transglycosylase MltG n=1 Tax=Nitratidesulfovibrio vulgaris TaxID=881 RepID=UPI002300F6AB|nr:endolytic transglycosylase MltG [Nitratidesulfovibrio vulgaris]WCB46433.1 endolytic transglycosylase MltG [Nitratidesulfovibrio vulgaris]